MTGAATPSFAPQITVIIVTRDRPEDLLRCLGSIASQRPRPNEVVVVSGSDSSCPEDLDQRFPELAVKVVECHEHNISRSRNAGLAATRCELALFIDDDAVARPGWIGAYMDAFARSPGAWAAGGIALDSRLDRMPREFANGAVSPAGRQIEVRDEGEPIPRGYMPNVKGCNFGVRRDQVLGVGGLDEFFAFAFDEADLMLTIARAGGQIIHEPGAVVEHAHTPGHYRGASPLDRDWDAQYASHTMFMLKHTSGVRERLLGWFVIARRLLKLACLSPTRPGRVANAVAGVRRARAVYAARRAGGR